MDLHPTRQSPSGSVKHQPALPPFPLSAHARARTQAFSSLTGLRVLLEKIATGESLPDILTLFCQMIEEQSPGMWCSILVLNDTTLSHMAAPSLPVEFVREMDGVEIGPQSGSCGTAAYEGETVIVSDITCDLRWKRFQDLALRHGLRACWSTPIFDSVGKVLGAFGMYFAETRVPDSETHGLVEAYAQLAGTAIERFRLESSLRCTTSRFRRLVESANLIPWEVEYATWRLSYIGPQVQQLLGFPEEYWKSNQAWERCLHKDDREWVATYCRETAKLKQDFDFEYRLTTVNGATVWVHDFVSVTLDQHGEPALLQGFLLDITKQKQAELAIQKNEERLQAIIDNSPAFVFVKDPVGRYLLVNRQWESHFSLPRKDVLGKTVHDVFPQANC